MSESESHFFLPDPGAILFLEIQGASEVSEKTQKMHNENVEIVHHMIVDFFFQFCQNQRVTFFTSSGCNAFLETQGASEVSEKHNEEMR